jgi:hypothetical protein
MMLTVLMFAMVPPASALKKENADLKSKKEN